MSCFLEALAFYFDHIVVGTKGQVKAMALQIIQILLLLLTIIIEYIYRG